MVRGCVWQGGMHSGKTVTEAGGTHPTGMHSCLELNIQYVFFFHAMFDHKGHP